MIIKADKSDLAEIVDLIIQMYTEGGYHVLLRDDAGEFILQIYKDLYDKGHAQHFIIRAESKIVALGGAFIKSDMLSSFRKEPFFGFLTNIYTIPEYRNKGYATLLTEKAIEWLRENKINDIKLVSTKNSRKIYEKMGFKATDEMMLSTGSSTLSENASSEK